MRETTAERWKPIPERPGYEASTHGRIRSLDRWVPYIDGRRRMHKGVIFSPFAAGKGHLWIKFGEEHCSIHSLILETWVGPRPEGEWGCHWDDDPTNNHLANLRWGTPVENAADMERNTGHYQKKKTHCPYEHQLVQPNLQPRRLERGQRICLACIRGRNVVNSAKRKGVTLEFQPIADAYYVEIMNGTWVRKKSPGRPRKSRAA